MKRIAESFWLYIWILIPVLGGAMSPDSVGPGGAFLKRIGDPGTDEIGMSLLAVPDGYLVGGGDGPHSFLLRYDASDELMWQRNFNLNPAEDFIRTMALDSEGHILLAGRDNPTGGEGVFFMRYDYENEATLWQRRFFVPDMSRIDKILEPVPGGNFFVFGCSAENAPPGQGFDLFLMEVDRTTGASLQQRHFTVGTTDFFTDGILANNSLYLSGAVRSGQDLSDIRPVVSRFDLFGNMLWTRAYLVPFSEEARLYATDIQQHADTLTISVRGNPSGDDLGESVSFLLTTNLNGDLLAAGRFDITDGLNERALELIRIPGGYLLTGDYYDTNSLDANIFIMRIDDALEVVWARGLDLEGADFSINSIVRDDHLYLTGWTRFAGSDNDIILAKLDLDGGLGSGVSCAALFELDVDRQVILNPFQGVPLMDEFPLTVAFDAFTADPLPGAMLEEDVCIEPPTELCGNGLDDDGDGLVDCCDPDLAGNPCCDTMLIIDLGVSPQLLCPGDSLILSPGSNFTSYSWSDGSTASSLAVTEAGWYKVEVEDAFCLRGTDSVEVEAVSLAIDLPDSLTLFYGDTLQLDAAVHNAPEQVLWQPPEGLSCTDCLQPCAFPGKSTSYVLSVADENGCEVSDTVFVLVEFRCNADAVQIPNVFTPNGDGVNDLFRPVLPAGYALRTAEMEVYNRWGERIFKRKGPLPAWDGKQQGKPAPSDTYVYIFRIFCEESSAVLRGAITLLR